MLPGRRCACRSKDDEDKERQDNGQYGNETGEDGDIKEGAQGPWNKSSHSAPAPAVSNVTQRIPEPGKIKNQI